MESEDNPRAGQQTSEKDDAAEALVGSELDAVERLQHIATQLIDARGIDALYQQILDTAQAILHSDFASLQMFYPERGSGGELRLLGHRGFSAEAARRWEWVQPTARTTCGEALRSRQRVAVADIRHCDFMTGSDHLEGYLSLGIHAVQTTPLVSRRGSLLGMVSTHWRAPHEMSSTELRALDVLARLAADLIERSRGEEALRRSEELFSSAMKNMGEGLYSLDKAGLATFVNPAAEKILGWASAELLGKKMHDVIHYKRLDGTPFPARECAGSLGLKNGIELHDHADVFIRKDGSFFPVVFSCSPLVSGGEIVGLVVVVRDDTERRRAEAALRESERRYREIFETFSECIFVLDVTPEGRFKFAGLNPAEEKATGLSSSEVAGKFIEEVFAEDFAKPLLAHYRRCVEAGTIIQYDDELNLPSGTRFFHTNLIPVRDGEGRIQRIIGCCMDFTDLKRAQQEVFAMQKLESVGTLARGIAHDFNNLLGGVLAQAELALAELAGGLHPEEELKRIRDVAIHGSEIVHQLMIYAGEEAAGVELVDVSGTVGAMLELLKVSVSKHAALQTDLGEDLRSVRASASQLRQIVLNLVTNASEAIGDRDGVIRVTTRCVSLDRATAVANGLVEGDYVQLEVSDTGRGITVEDQAKVFDPFFTTKSGGGHGLGLAVVHGTVRSLRGGIHLKSEPGKGSAFQIWLPCSETGAQATKGRIARSEEVPRPSQAATVLVVEDEDPLRQAVSKMLRKGGFSVVEASDGSGALEVIRAHEGSIDVLFLDITLPGAPSRDVLEEAKRLRPEMSVIVTSAYSKNVAAETLQVRVESFVRKPYRLNDVVDLIRQAL